MPETLQKPETSPSTGVGLLAWFHQAFGKITTDYNQFHKAAQQLEASAKAKNEKGVLVEGAKSAFLNRYYGVTHLKDMYKNAEDGARWAYYFAMCPFLERDVTSALYAWSKTMLKTPTFPVIRKVVATAGGTTHDDVKRFEATSHGRVRQETASLGISMAVSFGVSILLKRVGARAKTEVVRELAKTSGGVWKATGILGIFYGLGKISEAMHESGPFANHLRVHRDQFNTANTAEIRAVLSQFEKDLGNGFRFE